MEIIRYRKGFLFSLFVITALSLIILAFKMRVEFREEKISEMYKTRVEQTNLFIEDIENDIERSLYVSSFRAFLGADEYMIGRNEPYLEDVRKSIAELTLNGTIDGVKMNVTNASTFGDWINSVRELANRIDINITFNDIGVSIEQNSPWTVNISLESNVSIDDFEGIIGWNFSLYKSAIIDISEANFADPLYYKESIQNNPDAYPLVNNIRKTPYSTFWINQSGVINATYLAEHTSGQFYIKNEKAPSFLMRLMGKTDCTDASYTAECTGYGIESLVNVLGKGASIWEYSNEGDETCAADYQFFISGCTDKHQIQNMSYEFFLDWPHVIDYNLTSINSS